MFRLISKQFKIFRSIIILNIIDMMDSLFWEKVSSNHSFHNKAVFINIPFLTTKRVIGFINRDITILGAFFLHFLSMRSIFAFVRAIFCSISSTTINYKKLVASQAFFLYRCFKTNTITFRRTIFSGVRSVRFNIIEAITYKTFFNHIVTSKIKGTFRVLSDSRLGVSTLLSAFGFINKKIVSPIDAFIITYSQNLTRINLCRLRQ